MAKHKRKDRTWLLKQLEDYGYSVRKIADMFNYSRPAISSFFHGRRTMPDQLLIKLLNIAYFENKN